MFQDIGNTFVCSVYLALCPKLPGMGSMPSVTPHRKNNIDASITLQEYCPSIACHKPYSHCSFEDRWTKWTGIIKPYKSSRRTWNTGSITRHRIHLSFHSTLISCFVLALMAACLMRIGAVLNMKLEFQLRAIDTLPLSLHVMMPTLFLDSPLHTHTHTSCLSTFPDFWY